jgi:2-polyprenyl-6-methoxyphenol hydroxylase-like FAD-dependent oxidoreductase
MPVSPSSSVHDVVVIGGGLAGSLTSALLAHAGYAVAMIDCRARYPIDFRAEQVVGSQIDLLSKLGLLDPLLGGIVPVRHALLARHGRVIGGVAACHYGLTYEQLVARARACVALLHGSKTGASDWVV